MRLLVTSIVIVLFYSKYTKGVGTGGVFHRSSRGVRGMASSTGRIRLTVRVSSVLSLVRIGVRVSLRGAARPPTNRTGKATEIAVGSSRMSTSLRLCRIGRSKGRIACDNAGKS